MQSIGKGYLSLRFFSVLLIFFFSTSLQAEYILSAPPRENPQLGEKTYGPLAEFFSKILGESVVYEHPSGWARYANDMRVGKYDIVFDAPHFAAWRVKNLHHIPVARLPGELQFVVVAKKSANQLNKIRDLLAVETCALASPNLGTVIFYNMFTNPISMPPIYEAKGGFNGVYNAFKQDLCEAALLRDNFYNQLAPEDKASLKIIQTSRALPNQVITISQRLANKKTLITHKLLAPEGKKATEKLLERFGEKDDVLIPTSVSEVENLDSLLTGIVWGW
jgi:hypothetical protein